MNTVEQITSKLSDHQLLNMVNVMFADQHCAHDQTAVYVAAYREAERRGIIPEDW